MRYDTVPGLPIQLSTLVLGTYGLTDPATAFPVMDAYVASGGNCLDTAYVYSGGDSERTLGAWLEQRGIRDELVVIGKGAHTPECFPEMVGKQLDLSLDRLRTDHVDVYMLHRDNPEVPVGEFVAALAEQQDQGRIGVYGVSNWSLGRVAEANAWAEAHGRSKIVAVSNHLSLVEMVRIPWPGVVASSDADSRERLARDGLALFPWSTLAHGLFAPGGVERAQRGEGALGSWYSPENVARVRRAEELAARRGTTAAAIAVAFVLAQPFPTFPLIGPLTLEELSSSLQAAELALSRAELTMLLEGS